MKAFENTTMTKEEMISALKWHQEQDNFIRGRYFEDGKGCAVGCSLESVARTKNILIEDYGDHSLYEDHLGVPEWLAELEDTIFEGMTEERSKTWPLEFIEAINVGANLEEIKAPFLVFVLQSNLEGLQDEKFKEQILAAEGIIALWHRNDIGSKEWELARHSAGAAAESAWHTADYYSARSAARSAWYAAEYSARSPAGAAAESALHAARSLWHATKTAESATFEKFANKLLEIIRETK